MEDLLVTAGYVIAAGVMVCVSTLWLVLIANSYVSSKHLPSVVSANTGEEPRTGPKVSVIVPAKNEEEYIGSCLRSLVRQTYSNYEIVVIDDSSSDSTRHIVWAFAQKHPNIVFVRARSHPDDGWYGKNWPCVEGTKRAAGELLLFTDAGTEHEPQSIQSAVDYMKHAKVDVLTLTQKIQILDFWTRVTIPTVTSFKIVHPDGLVWFTSKAINDSKNRMGGLLGAYFLIKKEVYEAVGGHASVKGELLEDWVLGKRIKSAGHSLRIANGNSLVSALWARDLPTLEQIFSRLMMPLAARHKWKAIGTSWILLFLLFMPYPALVGSVSAYFAYGHPSALALAAASAAASALHMVSYVIQMRHHAIPVKHAVFAPLGGLMAVRGFINGLGLFGSDRAKNVWRDRITKKEDLRK